MDYKKKIDFAIKLLRSIPQDGPIEVSYSGGKDSDVILRLAQMAGIPFEAIYKQTSIDPPGTTTHAKEMGATIVHPRKTMMQIISEKGWPSRWTRFCCEVLKEYKIHDRAVQGIRRHESNARARRYKEPEICRAYPRGEKARVYLPILEWTQEDVARFIEEQKIKCAPIYYDTDGKFHVERRLGCIGCPLQADRGVSDFLHYPKLLKAEFNAYCKFFETHQHTKTVKTFKMPQDALFFKLFCDYIEQYETRVHPELFPETAINPREYLSSFFGIEF